MQQSSSCVQSFVKADLVSWECLNSLTDIRCQLVQEAATLRI